MFDVQFEALFLYTVNRVLQFYHQNPSVCLWSVWVSSPQCGSAAVSTTPEQQSRTESDVLLLPWTPTGPDSATGPVPHRLREAELFRRTAGLCGMWIQTALVIKCVILITFLKVNRLHTVHSLLWWTNLFWNALLFKNVGSDETSPF